MKDKINKLARGIVDLSAPSLYVAESSLEGELEPGENGRFRLNISSRNGVSMKGLVYSDHIFVKVERAAFGGIRSSVPLLVEGGDLSAGEELKGKLSVISNGGELQIPYCFRARLSAELREIRRLRRTEDFLRLYEEDPKLALQLFRRKDFREAPFLEDSRARLYFRAFSGNVGNAGKRELQEFSAALRRQSRGAETERRERGAETETAPFGERSFYLSEEELKDPRRVEEMARRLIEADIADPEAFLIYQRAIENGSRLTRLYEYCIYALPDSGIELPRELYLYFAYESRLEERMKLPLYSNVLRNFQEDSDIYQSFEREIQRFAIDKLLAGKIDERLSLIYERMIYPDMVDRRIARVLPQLLYTCEVFVEDPRMKKLILLQPELRREESFPIRDGRVFFPQYFPEAVILFQDEEGRRYGGVPYEKRRLLHKPELEKRCMELVPEQVFFRLLRAEQVLRNGIRSTAELAFLEKESESPLISSDFRHAILVSVLRCHSKLTEREAASLTKRDLDYLKGIAKEGKSLGERTLLFSDLLKRGEYESASELLLSHRIGWDRLLISDFTGAWRGRAMRSSFCWRGRSSLTAEPGISLSFSSCWSIIMVFPTRWIGSSEGRWRRREERTRERQAASGRRSEAWRSACSPSSFLRSAGRSWMRSTTSMPLSGAGSSLRERGSVRGLRTIFCSEALSPSASFSFWERRSTARAGLKRSRFSTSSL